MPLLKVEPQSVVKSLEELFAIAYAMEEEAAQRYAEIAERMRAEGQPSLAAVFERLSADEKGHLDSVVDWSKREKGRAPDPAQLRWTVPETFDDEDASVTDPQLLTAYRILSMAVRNEERAFAFWSYVAAHAPSPEIRQAAEILAHEELEHVATLRRERRRAYHAQHDRAAHKEGDPAAEMAACERRLAERLEVHAGEVAPDERDRLKVLAGEARISADELEGTSITFPAASGASPTETVALAEWLVDRYLDAADHSRDEAALAQAQTLAARAINRLSWLRADVPEIGRR